MADKPNYLESLFREMYKAEADRKNELNKYISVPIGVLAVIAGLGCRFMDQFPGWKAGGDAVIPFLIFWSLMMACVVVASTYIIRAIVNYEYGYVATPNEILTYAAGLRTKYSEAEPTAGTDVDEWVQEDVRDYLEAEFGK